MGAPRRAPSMNAIAMLKDDHDRVLEMFEKFERARSEDQKQNLADRICADLTLHAQIEEELFYPALREATGEEDLVDEAEVEHASGKMLIAQIQRGKAGDPQWDAKVKVLGEYVRHHIREEQREIFPCARKAKQLDLRALGERIAERKEGGPLPEMRATAAAMVGGEMGNADKARGQAPGMLESAVRTLLPGAGNR
jgi:hemerythrin-like domain-containing protein